MCAKGQLTRRMAYVAESSVRPIISWRLLEAPLSGRGMVLAAVVAVARSFTASVIRNASFSAANRQVEQ
jgi:hypothetical protein